VGCNPIQLRRAARWRTLSATDSPAAADDVGRWQPTLSEGAVFTAIGSGMLLGGGIVLGVGMAQLIPIVTDAAGLVTAAMNPLLAMGLGLTLEATIEDFHATIHAHPTLTEGVHEASLDAEGHAIHF